MAENAKTTGPVPAATAPFNFIPYDPDAVLDDWPKEERGHWSGRIVCQLKALTPLLVSGAQTRKSENEPSECRFATVDGKPVIPGTSIKGMLRNLVQILSFSAMRPLSRERLTKARATFKYSPYDLAIPDKSRSNADLQSTYDKGAQSMDFVTRLFGSVDGKAFKGRVSVSSAIIHGNPYKSDGVEVILGSPKSTCVALYLVQNKDKEQKKSNKLEELNNYDKENAGKPAARLRGWKMYWHHEVQDGLSAKNDNKAILSRLFPLPHAARAEIVIHVDRLADLELGALLEAIQLPKKHAHKLGMGKALGYGSIRLEIDWEQTAIRDMSKLHQLLTERLGAETAACDQETMEECRDRFRRAILDRVRAKYPVWKDIVDYDDLPPIKALRIMMNYAKKPHPEAVRYMPINKKDGEPYYGSNGVLPTPEKVNPRACNSWK